MVEMKSHNGAVFALAVTFQILFGADSHAANSEYLARSINDNSEIIDAAAFEKAEKKATMSSFDNTDRATHFAVRGLGHTPAPLPLPGGLLLIGTVLAAFSVLHRRHRRP